MHELIQAAIRDPAAVIRDLGEPAKPGIVPIIDRRNSRS